MSLAPEKVRIGVGDVRLSQQAILNVNEALANNRLSYGPFSRQFERRFAALHDRRFACFVNSGTDALRIGLAAMKERYGWKDGDTVLVPAVTFVASYNVVEQVGLRPMLVDIEPDYYSMDPTQVGEVLARYSAGEFHMPVAMMPVHLFGQPASAQLLLLANAFGLRTIADSCETMFVPGCALGDVSCFSTYNAHIIATGIGGLATTNDPELARLIRSLANHGRSGIYTGIDDELGNVEVIDARFRFERPGYSSRCTEMEAAIGCAELDVWEENLRARRGNAELLTQALSDLPLVLPKTRKGSQSAHMMYPVRAQDRVVRDALVSHLEARGVETRFCLPLTDQPYINRADDFPVAKMVNEASFYVGCHPHLSVDDLGHMSDAFHSFWRPM